MMLNNESPITPPAAGIPTKRCSKCGRVLPLSEFQKCSKNLDGLQYHCRDCHNEAARTYYGKKQQACRPYSGKAGNPELAAFTPRQLIEELKARGYTGELRYVQIINV